MKIRILALLLVLVLAFSALVACAPTPSPDEPCTKHVDKNKDKKCDKCGESMKVDPTPGPGDNPVVDETPDITWSDKVSLLYQLTKNSNDNELISGCMQYMAGDTSEVHDPQNTFYVTIKERNDAAAEYANVEITYDYCPNTSGYGWAGNITRIASLAKDKSDNGRPDIFCNFVYDMMSISLLGSFKNIYSQTENSAAIDLKDGDLRNYFAFATKGEYDPEYLDKDNGYMVEYMQSLSLSKNRMYLIASDYFTDLVRAFFVVPVNIQMLEAINPNVSVNPYITEEDKADGKYTIDEFYDLVWRGDWTYDAVAAFSKDVYAKGNGTDPLDDTLGWAVSASGGLSVSGLLYTTSITVIERKWNENLYKDDNGNPVADFEYWYPEVGTNGAKQLEVFCDNLKSLFGPDNPGVKAIGGKGEPNGTSYKSGSANNAIQERFSDNKVLFGGVICVGSLEGSEYREMVEDKGNIFGVVPVPLYRGEYFDEESQSYKTDKYLTQIHNLGKVAGISLLSKKFAPATAYLNYLSLNSSDILDEYYEYTLTAEAAGGSTISGTSDMLAYIRANVRTSFDKAFEDAIAKHYSAGGDSQLNSNKWHNIILSWDFECPGSEMYSKYNSYRDMKDGALEETEESYDALPA